MPGQLSQYFSGIVAKRLSEVEVAPGISNQHEFNGVSRFRTILGSGRITFQGTFIYITDYENDVVRDSGILTWYDARARHPERTEFRLYYSSNRVMEQASSGDLVVFGRIGHERLLVIVAPKGSTSERQLLWLFGLEEVGTQFVVCDFNEEDREVNYASQYVLDLIGVEPPDTTHDFLEDIINEFGTRFPNTANFSAFARSTLRDLSPVEEPDKTLLAWLEREELLFKTFERYLVAEKLRDGFGDNGTDVDEFISYSLSVQNRRKSRAGYAFENHLSEIFIAHNIRFSKGARTERNNKPDFLFPGIEYYRNPEFREDCLTMLGAKTSAKDRWRQVLSEADRIRQKHLITLEPAISRNQTDEMLAQNLQLVLPEPLLETYLTEQRSDLITLGDFINFVQERQRYCHD